MAIDLAPTIDLLRLALAPAQPPDDARRSRMSALQAALANVPCPVSHRLRLNDRERRVVHVLAAIAVAPDLRALVAQLERTATGDPNLETVRRIVYGQPLTGDAIRDLGEAGPLRRLAIIERTDSQPEAHERHQTWALSRRALAALHGDDTIDPALARIVRVPAARATSELAVPRPALELARRTVGGQAHVLAVGPSGRGRRTLLVAVAREAHRELLEIDAKRLATEPRELDLQLRRAARECALGSRLPVVVDLDKIEDRAREAVDAHLPGPILATARSAAAKLAGERATVVVEVGPATPAQRAQLWMSSLDQGVPADGERLANAFPLAPALIVRAAAAARVHAGGAAVTPHDIRAGVRSVVDDHLGKLATRLHIEQRWQDAVLAPDQRDQLVELVARFRTRDRVLDTWGFAAKVGRSLGIAALFSGPPGTGKSMCAGLIANELGIDVYQVDSARLTSKWIGETEQNLAALFDAAESSQAMLLFDEADALFGKRTATTTSNDRHANAQTNYLLQRIESFRGICVLTSNHESNIDPAFQRRLAAHVRFDVPDVDERVALWRAMIPANAPVAAELDFDVLARRYILGGGAIKNAVLRAAYVAASAGTSISQGHLDRAARVECEGLGKLVAGAA
jgi:AAA+ superfamily predicted ATPase|nr:ATP-binding protein [Kofleriaceae bacterium]